MKSYFSLIVAVACLSSTFCQASPTEMTKSDSREMIEKMQDSHQITLLSKEFNGQKQFVLLHAKLNQTKNELTRGESAATGAVSAGIIFAGLANLKGMYHRAKTHQKMLQRTVNQYGLNFRVSLHIDHTEVLVTAVALYAGFSLAKQAVTPYLCNNFYFREFNQRTSFSGDPVVKLAKKVNLNAKKSAAAAPNLVNVEFVDIDLIEG